MQVLGQHHDADDLERLRAFRIKERGSQVIDALDMQAAVTPLKQIDGKKEGAAGHPYAAIFSKDCALPLFDTTALHARAAVDRALG